MVEIHSLGEQNMEIPKAKTKNVTKMNKCKQCNYSSSHKGHLKVHMKVHSGEKTNKTIKDGGISPSTILNRFQPWLNHFKQISPFNHFKQI